MRIGLLTNFWYVRGGLERVVLADAEGLKRRGHDVLPFSSAHGLNEQTATGRYFPPSVDHGALGPGMSVLERSRAAIDLFHNRRAASAFEFMVQSSGPISPISTAWLASSRRASWSGRSPWASRPS